MTQEEQDRVQVQADEILVEFSTQNDVKLLAGQAEHGGNFFKKPTVQNIREEVIDLVNYTHVLALHQREMLVDLDNLIDTVTGYAALTRLSEPVPANVLDDILSDLRDFRKGLAEL